MIPSILSMHCELVAWVRAALKPMLATAFVAGVTVGTVLGQQSQTTSLTEVMQQLDSDQHVDSDTHRKQCGLICLFLFLKLHAVDVPYSEIQECVPIGEQGASLFDLAEASRKLGYSASAVRCAPARLSTLQLPLIAHIESLGGENAFPHYVLITKLE